MFCVSLIRETVILRLMLLVFSEGSRAAQDRVEGRRDECVSLCGSSKESAHWLGTTR